METYKEYISENTPLKVSLYIGSGIILIWILGKASLLLADASRNFKTLYQTLRHD